MDVMQKAAHLQTQVKQNNTDLTDFLKDLTRWEEKVKDEDANLKSERKLEENLPPVRSRVTKPKVPPAQKEKEKKEEIKTADRISSYDYDAWSKFDADAACKSESSDDSNAGSEEDAAGTEEDEEVAKELDKIQQQRSIQKSIMEKEKGNQLFKEGKYEAAINRYTSAISLNPRNPVLYANRGMALIKTDKYGAAEQDCDAALHLDPLYGKAIARRGTARKKLKKYREALEDFTHLLEIEPKNQQAANETKELKKLLLKSEEVSKSSEVQVKSVKLDEKEPLKRRSRSNKPLKRIHITMVGNDEPAEQKNEKIVTKNTSIPQVKHLPKTELTIPCTSFMFETEFKRLKNDGEELYLYLKLIHMSDYCKLFHQCIDAIISPFVNTLYNCYVRDNVPYHEEMNMFSTVPRFDMALMFLSRKDKEVLRHLLNNITSDNYKWPLKDGLLEKLLKKYDVKL